MTMNNQHSFPTQDERILASISHISIFFSTIGLLVPVIIWITQKDKSKFVAGQSLQALSLQIIRIGFQVLLGGVLMFSFLLMAGFSEFGDSSSFESAFFLINISIVCFLTLVSSVFVLFAIFGAIRSFQGIAFQYPIVGNLIGKLINNNIFGSSQGISR